MNDSINLNQIYNKSIFLKPHEFNENPKEFDLCYYVYHGKLTVIAHYFNSLPVYKCKEIVNTQKDKNNHDKFSLDIAAFLNFSNILLYLLTYDADPYVLDSNRQSVWHTLCYKGHYKLTSLIFNYEKFKIKMKFLAAIDSIKKSYGFSKLDIIKGKLSKAVNLTETNIKKFESLQNILREEALNFLKLTLEKYSLAFGSKDKEGRTPLHYAAMSKFSFCHVTVSEILDFDFFKYDEWDDFLSIYQDIQYLENNQERLNDPRRSLRVERELISLLGDDIITRLSGEFKSMKITAIKNIINSEDNSGDTVLHLASIHGDYRIVNKLLMYGGDKTLKNVEGNIPLDMARDEKVRKVFTNLNKEAKNSDEKNLVELINYGHDINSKISIFSQAPIHKVIESKSTDKHSVLNKMLDMGADPNIKDSNGWSPLHYCCQLGDLESAKILLKNKADINSFSNHNRRPIHMASLMNYPSIVRFLLENNSDKNFKDHLGCTPLLLAAKQGNVECVSILLQFGAKLYDEDFRKWNVLHYASFNGHPKTVRFLSKYDADYDILKNSKNSQNKLPIEIVREISIKTHFITLWHAAREGNLDIIRQLINDGENINELSTFMKNTPLHFAVLNNNYLMVRLLLSNNAVIDMRNKDGITPVEYAELMNFGIKKYIDKSKNLNTEKLDLKIIVKNFVNKKDKILDCVISEKNKNLTLWHINNFSEKICKAFKLKSQI